MPHAEENGGVHWWNYNIPPEDWTSECPEELRILSDKDKRIIGSWDEEYQVMGWDRVKHLIDTNAIDQFQRSPSELRRYRLYIEQLQKTHGSVMKFIINQRLRWTSLVPQGPPFACADDIKVLLNDWPYGIDSHIVHLVVWVKFELDDDPKTGHLTQTASQQVQEYVTRTFCSRMEPDHVAWFKNWKSLKSIQAVEHFHVMLFDPDMAFIHAITNGDVAQSSRAKGSTDI